MKHVHSLPQIFVVAMPTAAMAIVTMQDSKPYSVLCRCLLGHRMSIAVMYAVALPWTI
jgi:hypothetical protein